MFKKDKKCDTGFYVFGWCLMGALMMVAVCLRMTGWNLPQLFLPCTLRAVTGLYCPGCGGTRAVCAFFAGDILTAFVYHPFVPYVFLMGSWFMISQTIERISGSRIRIALHIREIYLWIALGIVIVNFLIKNMALLVFGIDLLMF